MGHLGYVRFSLRYQSFVINGDHSPTLSQLAMEFKVHPRSSYVGSSSLLSSPGGPPYPSSAQSLPGPLTFKPSGPGLPGNPFLPG